MSFKDWSAAQRAQGKNAADDKMGPPPASDQPLPKTDTAPPVVAPANQA